MSNGVFLTPHIMFDVFRAIRRSQVPTVDLKLIERVQREPRRVWRFDPGRPHCEVRGIQNRMQSTLNEPGSQGRITLSIIIERCGTG